MASVLFLGTVACLWTGAAAVAIYNRKLGDFLMYTGFFTAQIGMIYNALH